MIQLHHVKKTYRFRLILPHCFKQFHHMSHHLVLRLIHEAASLCEAAPSCGEALFDEAA